MTQQSLLLWWLRGGREATRLLSYNLIGVLKLYPRLHAWELLGPVGVGFRL